MTNFEQFNPYLGYKIMLWCHKYMIFRVIRVYRYNTEGNHT